MPPLTPITVTAREPQPAEGHTRYWLSNGWFIDREERVGRRAYGYRYSAWLPGGSPSGGALFLRGANRLAALLRDLNATTHERKARMTTPSRHGPTTKKEANRLARLATRYGYSKRSETEADARCPRCQERVTAYKFAWEKFTQAKWNDAFHRHVKDAAVNEESGSA